MCLFFTFLFFFFFLMIRRPPRSTLFPTRRSSDLDGLPVGRGRGAVLEGGRGRAAAAGRLRRHRRRRPGRAQDRKSTRLNSSHVEISYAVFCLKKKKRKKYEDDRTN